MSRLDLTKITVQRLLEDFGRGEIAIPEFQRDYVWKPNKGLKLIDSIYKKYPTGLMLFWRPDLIETRVSSKGGKESNRVNYWLIDGQQRTRTVYEILSEGTIEVFFNPTIEYFTLKRPNKKTSGKTHPLRTFLSDDYLSLRKTLRETYPAEESKIEQAIDKCRQILSYEIPIVRMEGYSLDEAVNAFERINTSATKLESADITAAKITFQNTGFINENVLPLMRFFKQHGYERIYLNQMFAACSAIAKNSPQSNFPQLHTLPKIRLKSSWRKTEEGIKWVLSILKSELGITDMKLLWSGAPLMPMAVAYATHRLDDRQVFRLIKWMLFALLKHRYSSQAFQRLKEDLNAALCVNPIDRLMNNLGLKDTKAKSSYFETTVNDKFALLALFLSLKHNGAKDLKHGTKIEYRNFLDFDKHHLFPISGFKKEQKNESNNISNISLIDIKTNRNEFKDKQPIDYLPGIKESLRTSQLIPLDEQLYSKEKYNEFIKARKKLIINSFNDFIDKLGV